ncbi:aminotransferase class I/II-fold pyridoxal phosphate-dependent enzyme [Parabacteroides gordonii]|uniref:aminotransferase class I/II-fold pyridoxal phosphate-dependent enzyme n=1 Tax=Parabacteroides gordonii TaxID=574930 RepID=UPI0026EE8DAF|nr:aminotransferase class I/II-fold pyridoxal phosphate-dependent enzyme [Parabacteroides gordonii]
MQVIILAAGMGKRLGELTKNNTKCMIRVNGVTLIERVLAQFSVLNLNRVIIVIGYKGEELRNFIGDSYKGLPIEYVINPIYDVTNNIYSLFLAKEQLQEDDTLLIESDLIFEDRVLDKILSDPYPNIALVAKYESWMDGTVVMLDHDNNILNFVTKKAFDFDYKESYYKTVNIYKFSKEFSITHYVPFLNAYINALGDNEYYEQVLRVIALLDKPDLKALPLSGEKWYEIDDIQDLNNAESIFAEEKNKLSLYQKRYGGYWRFPSLVDFCYLVNPFFPTQKMKKEMRANFDTLLSEYPSGLNINSLLAAKYFGLLQDYVCPGNGAAELIKSLMKELDGTLGIVYPTFEEYPNRKKTDLVTFLPENNDFKYTVDDLINYFSENKVNNLLLINPDNPSGNFISREDLFRLGEWTLNKNIRLIIDESFVDFSDSPENNSLLYNNILEKYSNLIVIKSISKSYGVPGLRLGILASSNIGLVKRIREDISIWNINSFAEFYMQIFNKYELDYKRACELFVKERNRFYKDLKQIEFLRVIPSQANYFLCEVTCKYSSRELAELLLSKYNILIKDCSAKSAFKEADYIRIAIRSTSDNQMLVNALKEL